MMFKMRIFIAFLLLLSACESEKTRKNKIEKPSIDSFFEKIESEEIMVQEEFGNAGEIKAKKPIKIALFLPMTGAYSKIGIEGVKVVEILKRRLGANLEIQIFDTMGRKDAIFDIYNQFIKEDFNLIIGPLFNFETQELSRFERNLPIISLSNDREVGKNNVISFGISQDLKLIDATNFFIQNGHKNIITFFPNSTAGSANYRVVKRVIDANDGEIMRAEFYDNTGISDVSKYANKVISGLVEKLYKNRETDEILTQRQMNEILSKTPNFEIENQYEIIEKRADLVFISGAGIEMKKIAKIFHDAKIAEKLQNTSVFFADLDFPLEEKRIFEGAFFYTNTNNVNQSALNDVFELNTGKNPTKFGSLLYDAILYAVNTNNNAFGKIAFKDLVKYAEKFEGVNGSFFITRENSARRKGKMMIIKGGMAKELEFHNVDESDFTKEERRSFEENNDLD